MAVILSSWGGGGGELNVIVHAPGDSDIPWSYGMMAK